MVFNLFSHKRAVGIDIADHTIELVELKQEGERPALSSTYRTIIPAGVVVSGRVQKKKTLIKIIEDAFQKASPHPIAKENVIAALPERHVFIHAFTITLPQSGSSESDFVDTHVEAEAKGHIPYEKPAYAYTLREGKNSRTKHALIVGSGSEIVHEWKDIFDTAGITLPFFDIEPLAIARGIYIPSSQKNYCIVDIGHEFTSFAIYSNQTLIHTHTFPFAGKHLTQGIAGTLKVSFDDAQKMKETIGLADPQDPVFGILHGGLKKIIQTVIDTLAYVAETQGATVDDLYLVGGGAHMKKIVDFVADNSSKNVYLAKPRIATKKDSLLYVEAVGLAMRGMYKFYEKRDPAIPLSDMKDASQKSDTSIFSRNLFKK